MAYMSEEELTELYDGLSFPSGIKFKRAVEVAGGKITITEANKIAARNSQRQITAPRNQYSGKMTAAVLDSRWQADLASFVAQEAVVGDTTFTHVLCVLDVFSRYLWTRRLESAQSEEVRNAFVRILNQSGRKPVQLNFDKGVELNSSGFMDMLAYEGIEYRVSENKNDIATLDRAISTLKVMLTRRTNTTGAGNWAQELAKATRSYNFTGHEHLGDQAPARVEDNKSIRFSLQKQASKDVDTQDAVTRKRIAKLDTGATFRAEETSKLKGFARERAAKPKFEQQTRTVASRVGGDILDTQGESYSASRAKPIPANSNALKNQVPVHTNTQSDRIKRTATRDVALALHAKMPRVMDIAAVTKSFSEEENNILQQNRLRETKIFLLLHPKLFGVDKRNITKL